MSNWPFSPGSGHSVWVHLCLFLRSFPYSCRQCNCQSEQQFLFPLAPQLTGLHNISQHQTIACLPWLTIWLLWGTILTHITNYTKRKGKKKKWDGKEKKRSKTLQCSVTTAKDLWRWERGVGGWGGEPSLTFIYFQAICEPSQNFNMVKPIVQQRCNM